LIGTFLDRDKPVKETYGYIGPRGKLRPMTYDLEWKSIGYEIKGIFYGRKMKNTP
jgi:hypothetical protein